MALMRRGGLRRIPQLTEQRTRNREKTFARLAPMLTEELDKIKVFLRNLLSNCYGKLKQKKTDVVFDHNFRRNIFPRLRSAKRQEKNLRKDLEEKPHAEPQAFRTLMVILRASVRRLRCLTRRHGVLPSA